MGGRCAVQVKPRRKGSSALCEVAVLSPIPVPPPVTGYAYQLGGGFFSHIRRFCHSPTTTHFLTESKEEATSEGAIFLRLGKRILRCLGEMK